MPCAVRTVPVPSTGGLEADRDGRQPGDGRRGADDVGDRVVGARPRERRCDRAGRRAADSASATAAKISEARARMSGSSLASLEQAADLGVVPVVVRGMVVITAVGMVSMIVIVALVVIVMVVVMIVIVVGVSVIVAVVVVIVVVMMVAVVAISGRSLRGASRERTRPARTLLAGPATPRSRCPRRRPALPALEPDAAGPGRPWRRPPRSPPPGARRRPPARRPSCRRRCPTEGRSGGAGPWDSRFIRCVTRLSMAASRPAPKPLSMFTTATPAAQEFSMVSRAATPAEAGAVARRWSGRRSPAGRTARRSPWAAPRPSPPPR